MSITIDCHGESHVGQARPANEDQYLIADLNKSMRVHQTSLGLSHQTRLFGGSQGKLLLVADGLGGHESGERASTLAVDGVANYVLNAMDWFFKINDGNEVDFREDLKAAFHHSQRMLEREAEAIPQRHGMATTLTLGFIDWPQLYVVHVGDTRCYHISGASLKQLTTDHSLAQLAAAVEETSSPTTRTEESQSNRMHHVLYNVVGGPDKSLEPEISKSEIAVGDTLLLCSDGLTRHVMNDELLMTASQEKTAAEICKQFIEMANDRGGKDNITVIVAKFLANGTDDAQALEAAREGGRETDEAKISVVSSH